MSGLYVGPVDVGGGEGHQFVYLVTSRPPFNL